MWEFLKRLFGFGESQEARVRRLAKAAGILVAANNPGYVALLKESLGIAAAAVSSGQDKSTISTLTGKALKAIIKVAEKPEEKVALSLVLGELNFDEATQVIPGISIPLVGALVMGFLEGLSL